MSDCLAGEYDAATHLSRRIQLAWLARPAGVPAILSALYDGALWERKGQEVSDLKWSRSQSVSRLGGRLQRWARE